MKRLALAAMLSITTGLLTCGCMWGHVRDANTASMCPALRYHGWMPTEIPGLR